MRHRFAVTNWLTAAYRIVQLVARQAVHLGGTLPRKVSTGEVVAIGTNDMSHIGDVMDVSARFAGAVVSFLLVAVILLQTSVTLGLVVLIGVPLLMLLHRPAAHAAAAPRRPPAHLMGDLSNTATDIVGGLRVLRGIGGEQVFHDRYRRESQTTRRAGVEVARLQSVLDALQVFLPGIFVVRRGLARRPVRRAGPITPGELVAFYGYSAFLMIPLRTATEYANKLIRARVAGRPGLPGAGARARPRRAGRRRGAVPARRLRPVRRPHRAARPLRPAHRDRVATGPTRRPRSPTGSACCAAGRSTTTSGSAAYRSPRCAGPTYARRIVVSDTGSTLFSGPARRPARRARRPATSTARWRPRRPTTSSRRCPTGLDTEVAERGRTFSGGQRQRLVLARALTADPEVLVLVEPTSAVDAHTEARIAARLRDHRRRPHHGRDHLEPAAARRRRRGRLPAGRPGRGHRHATRDLLADVAGLPRRRHPRARRSARAGQPHEHRPAPDRGRARALRRYVRADRAPRHPRLLVDGAGPARRCAAVAALAAPRLLGDLVEAVETGTTVGHVDTVVADARRLPRPADGAHPVRPLRSARSSARRCSPSCARTSSATRWRCRSASSSRPAPATC